MIQLCIGLAFFPVVSELITLHKMSFAVCFSYSCLEGLIICSLISLLGASSNQQDNTYCNATSHGGSASITCDFNQDITRIRPLVITVEHYRLNVSKPMEVLICTWISGAENSCEIKAGYELKGTATRTLTLDIKTVTADNVGHYACKMMSPGMKPAFPSSCQLPVAGNLLQVQQATKASNLEIQPNVPSETTKQPEEPGVSNNRTALIVGLTLGSFALFAAVAGIIFYFRKHRRNKSLKKPPESTKEEADIPDVGKPMLPKSQSSSSTNVSENSQLVVKESNNKRTTGGTRHSALKKTSTRKKSTNKDIKHKTVHHPIVCRKWKLKETVIDGGRLSIKWSDVTMTVPLGTLGKGAFREIYMAAEKHQEIQPLMQQLNSSPYDIASDVVELRVKSGGRFKKPVELCFPHRFPSSDDPSYRVFCMTKDDNGDIILKCLPRKLASDNDSVHDGHAPHEQTSTFDLFTEGKVCIRLIPDFGGYVCVQCKDSNICVNGCEIHLFNKPVHNTQKDVAATTDHRNSIVDINNDLYLESSGTGTKSEETEQEHPQEKQKDVATTTDHRNPIVDVNNDLYLESSGTGTKSEETEQEHPQEKSCPLHEATVQGERYGSLRDLQRTAACKQRAYVSL